MKKRGFTLVETLIALVIIGVVIAIMLPGIRRTIPDKNKAKVRKAYNTLTNVVDSLTNDSSIYLDGDLGTIANNTAPNDEYFCRQFSDKINTSGNSDCSASGNVNSPYVNNISQLDEKCTKTNSFLFKTPDNIFWYGMKDTFQTTAGDIDENGIDTRYVVVCIDTDPSDEDENSTVYAFGVRRDGKIIVGTKAQAVLDEDDIE